MRKLEKNVIEKSPSSIFVNNKTIKNISSPLMASPIYLSSSSSETENAETPIRHIVCLKNADDLNRYEETEDCFILDFDPHQPTKNLISLFDNNDASDISLVAEKGQVIVACRDYPHSRHLCLKFPFDTTSHETHCDMCYCYVCDSPAPCANWKDPRAAHCDAAEKIDSWKLLRLASRAIASQH